MNKKHFRESEEIWDSIADSFDKTRKKAWREVIEFIETFSKDCIIVKQ